PRSATTTATAPGRRAASTGNAYRACKGPAASRISIARLASTASTESATEVTGSTFLRARVLQGRASAGSAHSKGLTHVRRGEGQEHHRRATRRRRGRDQG